MLCGAKMSESAQIVQEPAKIALGREAELCPEQFKAEGGDERLVKEQAPQQSWAGSAAPQ